MNDGETGAPGAGATRATFPETPWSSVLSDPQLDSPKRRERLTRLCSLYWRPVYAFIRMKWGRTTEDASDLTQAFFCHVIESEFVANFQPKQGRFRHFLKGALRHFLANVHRDGQRLKRGGGRKIVPIDAASLDAVSMASEEGVVTPEELFDLQWARDVISNTLEELKADLARDGKEIHYKVYEAYELYPEGKERPTYREVAESLGISVDDVKNHLTHARARFRDLMMQAVSLSVTNREELMQEVSELFSE